MDRRRQALQLCLDAAVVVVVQIVQQFPLEVLHRSKFLQIQQFAFEQAKKILHHGIVQAVALAAHALPDTLTFEHVLVLLVLILPALVRVKDQPCSVRYGLKSFLQHGSYHTQNRSFGDRIAYQIAVMQIQDGREIQFLAKQAEFRHICNSFLVGLFGQKAAV